MKQHFGVFYESQRQVREGERVKAAMRFLDGDDFWNLPDALERLADAAFGV